jgi:hypothetical protein
LRTYFCLNIFEPTANLAIYGPYIFAICGFAIFGFADLRFADLRFTDPFRKYILFSSYKYKLYLNAFIQIPTIMIAPESQKLLYFFYEMSFFKF